MKDFFCSKRYDINFSDLHKLIKLILPETYITKNTRGIYKNEYQPCNIIEIYKQLNNSDDTEYTGSIYCWLGRRGLTVLTNTEFTVSLCIEVLKEVKQNAEDYKVLSYDHIDEDELCSALSKADVTFRLYKQMNASEDTSRLIIKEYTNDEVLLEFFKNPDLLRVSGDTTSLLSYVVLTIEKLLNETRNNSDKSE